MKWLITALLLQLYPLTLVAKEIEFVTHLSDIARAPSTTDTFGQLFGVSKFIRLQQPTAIGAYGRDVYIYDAGPNLFYRYNLNHETLQELPNISNAMQGGAADITVMPDLSFYVADPVGHQVILGSVDGQVLRRFSDAANLASPVATAVDSLSNYLLVADNLYDHIVGFNQSGWLIFGFGERGLDTRQSQLITDMSAGPRGLYVLDRNPQVKVYSLDGKYMFSFARNEVTIPSAIAVDLHDRVYVADNFDDTIKVYVGEEYVGKIGGTGSAPGYFREITDLYISQNFLYVCDSMNARVQVFVIDRLYKDSPKTTPSATATTPQVTNDRAGVLPP